MNARPVVRFGIRAKLFVFVLVAFAALIGATVWQIGRQAQAVSNQAIDRSLMQSSAVLETKIDSRFNSILEVATGIARDSRILPLVYDGDSATLQDQTQEFRKVLDFDILFFTDAEGNVLARSDRPDAIGQNMAGKTPFFDQALAGAPAKGYFQSQGRLYQIVAVPIVDNVAADLVRGTVALAYEFSGGLADEINALTASDIGFLVVKREQGSAPLGLASTYNTGKGLAELLDGYFSSRPDQVPAVLAADSRQSAMMRLTLAEDDYFAVSHPLSNAGGPPLGLVLALRSSAELLKPYTELQRMVLLGGALCLLAASLFAWIFSRRISRPIIELVTITQNIEDGHYPDGDTKAAPRDEIGLLYGAVLKMARNLREKAELESYLAQISNELDDSDSLSLTSLGDDVGAQTLTAASDHTQVLTEDQRRAVVAGSDDSLRPGVVVDERYELLRPVGRGAMGVVYLAMDRELNEQVAVKLIAKALFSRHETINFKEEIRLARRITHRNILRTFDFGDWQDYYYITMEYVSGYDLDQLLRSKGRLDEHIALVMARQICSAISAAHAQGIIHLDLKPANMMINRQGILKIMDFGLARRLAAEGDQGAADRDKAIVGTPRYMAPEQFLRGKLDERTDIYAIGIILFTLFTGRPPFDGNDYVAIAEQHLHGDLPDMVGKRGAVSPALAAIIAKAVEKNPEDRFQSVTELVEAIGRV